MKHTLAEPKNQFPFIRAALSTRGRAKSHNFYPLPLMLRSKYSRSGTGSLATAERERATHAMKEIANYLFLLTMVLTAGSSCASATPLDVVGDFGAVADGVTPTQVQFQKAI